MTNPRSRTVIIAALVMIVFALVNGGAYRGYFWSDDLDTLSWASVIPAREFGDGLIDPCLSPYNFRPVGHFFYYVLARVAGEQFWEYVLVLQLLHLVNSWMLYRLLRRLGFDERPTLIGVLFFLFHMALFAAYWKPMYVFDVVCGTFCLATLLCWLQRRWFLALGCFWLAYKSKEVAIGLPAVLALYEFTLGKRQWKLLVPFFAISLSFGIQAMLAKQPESDYTLRFTLGALIACVTFYGVHLLLPVAAAVWLRERTAWWGLLSGLMLLAPLLFLPGRLFSVYLYVPAIAFAIPIAAAARRAPMPVLAVALLALALLDYRGIRQQRRAYLPQAEANREFVTQLRQYLQAHPDLTQLTYDGAPMEHYGVAGAARWFLRNPALEVRAATANANIHWDPARRKLE